jgi:hypothetical protein
MPKGETSWPLREYFIHQTGESGLRYRQPSPFFLLITVSPFVAVAYFRNASMHRLACDLGALLGREIRETSNLKEKHAACGRRHGGIFVEGAPPFSLPLA